MNRKILFSLAVLYSITSLVYAANTEVTPTIVARSQGRDAMRKLVGVSGHVHKFDAGKYVNLTAMPEYTQTFRGDKIAHCLFGNDVNCGKVKIQGSAITGEDRCETAWLADYFYLPPDYNSHFTIEPRIKNFLVDLDAYIALDALCSSMYIRLHGPINWTQWDLNFNESCDQETTGSYNYGYFDTNVMLNNQLLGSFGDYAQGDSPLNTTGITQVNNTSVEFQGLQFATIDGCKHSKTGFADLRLEIGGNLFEGEDYHFGINAQIAAPTGSKTHAHRAFDPVVGNRRHWEFGGGLTGHYTFCHGDTHNESAGLYFDLSLTHIASAKEQRTFDLCNRPNSRYMLAEKLGRPVQFLLGDGQTPVAQFQGVFTPVANLTTINVDVKVGLQVDFAVMLNYTREKWGIDIGYNLWARTCEKFGRPQELPQCCPTLCDGSKDVWALKGDAHVFGFTGGAITSGPLFTGNPIPLSATQCGSSIHNGTNATTEGGTTECPGISILQNCGVDSAVGASASDGTDTVNLLHTPGVADTDGNRINTSLEPKFINCCDINLQRTKGLSNKIFANLNYTFEPHTTWVPYISAGGFIEFGHNSDCEVCETPINCDQDCDKDCNSCEPVCCTNCLSCSVSQWGLFVKGGINFN